MKYFSETSHCETILSGRMKTLTFIIIMAMSDDKKLNHQRDSVVPFTLYLLK